MYTRRAVVVGLLAAGFLAAQDASPTIQVAGAVKRQLALSAGDLATMPRATLRVSNNGMETVYEGAWLHEVLKVAGVPQASQLRGKALAGAQARFRLVVPKDRVAARSIRMLTKLEVVQLRK